MRNLEASYLLEYKRLIDSGKIVACKKLKMWLDRLEKDMDNPKWIYDLHKGQKPIRYIEKRCRHSKGDLSGKPLLLHISQKAYFEAKYGFINANTGYRRFKESLLLEAKKNGKSTTAAGESLYLSSGDGEMGAEVYIAANSLDQTDNVFEEAYRMTLQNPVLNGHENNKKGLYHKSRNFLKCRRYFSYIQRVPVSPGTLDGKNVHGVTQDEIHESESEMYDILSPGVSARNEAMYSMYSTMGTVRGELCDRMYDYAKGVIEGAIEDDAFFPWIYEQDSEDEIFKPELWEKSNPLIGIAKQLDYMERTVVKMKNDPRAYNNHATKDFNIPKNQEKAFMHFSDYNNEEAFDLKEIENCYAIGAADLSRVNDLTSALLLVYKPSTDMFYALHKSWIPGDSTDLRTKQEHIPYDIWVDKGFIDESGTNIILHSDVTEWFKKMKHEYRIYPYWVGYDRALSSYWIEEMKQELYPSNWKDSLVEVPQGPITFNTPMHEIKALLQNKKIIFQNDQVLKWSMGNVAEKSDKGGNIGPDKAFTKNKKIDPFMALLDAYTVFSWKKSIYLSLMRDR